MSYLSIEKWFQLTTDEKKVLVKRQADLFKEIMKILNIDTKHWEFVDMRPLIVESDLVIFDEAVDCIYYDDQRVKHGGVMGKDHGSRDYLLSVNNNILIRNAGKLSDREEIQHEIVDAMIGNRLGDYAFEESLSGYFEENRRKKASEN